MAIFLLLPACSDKTEDILEAELTGLEAEGRQEILDAVSRVMQNFARAEFETDGIPKLMTGPSFKDSRGERLHETIKGT